MASASTRSARIHDYAREIAPDLHGTFWMRRRIVAELTDHLLETAGRLRDQGLTWADAEERAIAQFGSPRFVARTFAQSKGVGVPTTFTRYSGLAGIVGSSVLVVALIWQELSETFMHGAFAEVALVGMALLATALIGVYIRCRGQLGRRGRLGFQLFVAGNVIAWGSSMLWFGAGAFVGLLTLLVGFFIYTIALFRADVLPRSAIVTLIAGAALGLIVGVLGIFLDSDTGVAATIVASGVIAAGLIQIGWFLWTETSVGGSDWAEPTLRA